jgi:microsomal dipeptidase-like Zn-dependent dipeptidase
MGNPPFIDIHVHPDVKTFLSANEEENRRKCWQSAKSTPLISLIDKILLGNILGSQSSLKQLNHSNGTIGFVGVCALEKSMLKGDLLGIPGINTNLLNLAKVLCKRDHKDIINHDLLKRISPRRYPYYKIFKEEETHLLKSRTIPPGYKLLNRISEYDPAKLNIVLTLEGGHNLFNKTYGGKYKKHVLDNLRELKLGNNHYLFMSLAHLSRNRLATHAYGMKLLHDRRFKPVGYGLRKLGKKVIKEALRKPKRILIDIKHLSLESRKQYYEILKKEYSRENIPIIASHTGVTGVSYNNMPVVKCRRCWRWKKVLYYKPDGLSDTGTKFNPWSVNLYDEEIKTIVDSKGLIGLSLDERILGTKQNRKAQLIEYFSSREFSCRKYRHNHAASDHEPPLSNLERRINEIEALLRIIIGEIIINPQQFLHLENLLNEIGAEYDRLQATMVHVQDDGIKHLCNNILHIVKVAGSTALKHISIGSDFDGYVDAVKGCNNSIKYNSLSRGLKKWLPEMASHDPSLPPLININQIVDDIMFGNAYEFLKVNFTGT